MFACHPGQGQPTNRGRPHMYSAGRLRQSSANAAGSAATESAAAPVGFYRRFLGDIRRGPLAQFSLPSPPCTAMHSVLGPTLAGPVSTCVEMTPRYLSRKRALCGPCAGTYRVACATEGTGLLSSATLTVSLTHPPKEPKASIITS